MGEGQVSNLDVVADDKPGVGEPVTAEERADIDAQRRQVEEVGRTGDGDFDAAQVVDTRAAHQDPEVAAEAAEAQAEETEEQ